jgi:glutamate synthase (NADPH/NADH) small chain
MYDVYTAPPPDGRYDDTPWPEQPRRSVTTYALDEGGERHFGHQVTELIGSDGRIAEITGRQVKGRSSRELTAIEGTDFRHPCDLLLIAIGFTGPARDGLLTDLDIELNSRGSIKAGTFLTSTDGVFACGDARVGQSLIVTAIADGRRCARVVDRWLSEKETPAAAAAAT